MLWPSARRELEAFKGLMILVAGEWSSQWNREVFTVDASLTGYCIEKSIWPHIDVSSVGRTRERWRYKMGGEKARSHALALGGFTLCEDGHLLRDSDGEFVHIPADLRDQAESLKFEKVQMFLKFLPGYLQVQTGRR